MTVVLWNPTRAPALPIPDNDDVKAEYVRRVNHVLRLYFNQIDAANAAVRTAVEEISLSITDDYLYIPTSFGPPVDPPPDYDGHVAMVFDRINNDLYIYNGSWKSVTVT